MGTSVRTITDKVSLIASAKTWIEGRAVQQLTDTSALCGMRLVAGMPDLHPGRGYPIGAAFFSCGRIYPALVGNDIGCGMAFWQTNVKATKLKLDKMAAKLVGVEGPPGSGFDSLIELRKAEKEILNDEYDAALGTIGGGNHFAEFQKAEEILEPSVWDAAGLDRQQLQLLVHSGSRGLGQAVLTDHVSRFGHAGLVDGSPELSEYLQAHDQATRWAELNRELIAARFLTAVRAEGKCCSDINHNLVEAATIQGGFYLSGTACSVVCESVLAGSWRWS